MMIHTNMYLQLPPSLHDNSSCTNIGAPGWMSSMFHLLANTYSKSLQKKRIHKYCWVGPKVPKATNTNVKQIFTMGILTNLPNAEARARPWSHMGHALKPEAMGPSKVPKQGPTSWNKQAKLGAKSHEMC